MGCVVELHRNADTFLDKLTKQQPADAEAIENAVADLAEQRNHHPDIDIRYWNLTFRLSTHSEGGITGKDVELAGEIDRVLAAAG